MSDLFPLEPCPYDKRGSHDLSYLIPDTADGWLTVTCDHCGIMRRVPASGELAPVLDQAPADWIEAMVRGSETR